LKPNQGFTFYETCCVEINKGETCFGLKYMFYVASAGVETLFSAKEYVSVGRNMFSAKEHVSAGRNMFLA